MKTQLIRAKLRSQQGASILFALFFFIVCAVIGSIVLTAATAAAGRLEGVKERNQRYYAVNSAADVLVHELDKPEMKVDKTISIKTTTKVGSNEPSITDTEADNLPEPEYDSPLAALLYSPPGETVNYTFSHGTDDPLNAEIRKIVNYSTADDQLSLDNPPPAGQPAPTNDYNRKLQICSTDGKYSLILDCPAHIDRRQSVRESTKVTVNDSGNRVETQTTTTTTTYTITWSVASVVKGGPVS